MGDVVNTTLTPRWSFERSFVQGREFRATFARQFRTKSDNGIDKCRQFGAMEGVEVNSSSDICVDRLRDIVQSMYVSESP